MPEYKNGTPSWVDLGSPDMDASAAFYGGLFGWTLTEPGDVEESGGYRMFLKDGKLVAGLGPAQDGQPVVWTTYLAADDADATAEKAKANGGMVILEPFDVLDAGRMAIIVDGVGASFGVWQPNQHRGAELMGSPGSVARAELLTRQVDGAVSFYGAVFGVEPDILDATGDEYPPDIPSHWLVHFAVDDASAAADRVTALGGVVQHDPVERPGLGRAVPVTGPTDEPFVLLELA